MVEAKGSGPEAILDKAGSLVAAEANGAGDMVVIGNSPWTCEARDLEEA